MSETRIVHARPPAKRPPGGSTWPDLPTARITPPSLPMLDARDALITFRRLVQAWQLDQAQAWRMLTGESTPASGLTADQVLRVSCLAAIDAGMREIGGQPVGTWLVSGNAAPLLGGASPAAYLTRQGTAGFTALLRQVERWMAL